MNHDKQSMTFERIFHEHNRVRAGNAEASFTTSAWYGDGALIVMQTMSLRHGSTPLGSEPDKHYMRCVGSSAEAVRGAVKAADDWIRLAKDRVELEWNLVVKTREIARGT
jgi:hypothetical protein